MVCQRSSRRVRPRSLSSPVLCGFSLICGFRLANKAWLKVADLAALAGQYQRAIERYESVARASLNSNLTKWSVKDYFFKAGACYLANKVGTHNIARFLTLRTLFPRNQPSNGSSSRTLHLRQRGNAFYYKYISPCNHI